MARSHASIRLSPFRATLALLNLMLISSRQKDRLISLMPFHLLKLWLIFQRAQKMKNTLTFYLVSNFILLLLELLRLRKRCASSSSCLMPRQRRKLTLCNNLWTVLKVKKS